MPAAPMMRDTADPNKDNITFICVKTANFLPPQCNDKVKYEGCTSFGK